MEKKKMTVKFDIILYYDLLTDPNLSHTTTILFGLIDALEQSKLLPYKNGKLYDFYTNKALAQYLGVGTQTVSNSLRILKKRGFITERYMEVQGHKLRYFTANFVEDNEPKIIEN